jgi:hypothetical protein
MYSWMPWRNGTNFLWGKILFPNSLFNEAAPSSPRETFDCFPIIIFKKTTYDKDNISYEI